MEKKITIMLVLGLCGLLLGGCWDRQEFTAISFATAMALDKSNDSYEVTVKALIPQNFASNQTSSEHTMINAKGKTLQEALQEVNLQSPRKIYWGHMKTLILGKDILSENCIELLADLTRVNDFGLNTAVVCAKEQGKAVLHSIAELSQVDNFYLYNLLRDKDERYKGSLVTIKDFLVKSTYEGESIYLPYVVSEKTEEEKSVPILSLGVVMKEGRMRWESDENFDKAYRWLANETKNGLMVIQEEACNYSFQIFSAKSKIKWDKKEEMLCVEITGSANLAQNYGGILQGERLDYLKEKLEAEIEFITRKCIEQAQINKSDVFGFLQQRQNALHSPSKGYAFETMPVSVHASIRLKPHQLAD